MDRPSVKIRRRPDGWWSYEYRTIKGGWGIGSYVLLRDALRTAVGCALGFRWGWHPGWWPNYDHAPLEHDDWTITTECGHVITRTYLHDNDLDRLPKNLDEEPMAFCPEHGFETIWYTTGTFDPSPWYAGEPGFREFGWRRPVAS